MRLLAIAIIRGISNCSYLERESLSKKTKVNYASNYFSGQLVLL